MMRRRLAIALLLTGTCAAAQSAVFQDAFADGQHAGPVMVMLPGGETVIGDKPHRVLLSPFAIARDDVTNADFLVFLSERGDKDAQGIEFLVPREDAAVEIRRLGERFQVLPGKERLPVTGVSWTAALAYAQWLSERTGKAYFLPTEAQWEYAARAGSQSIWPWGDDFDAGKALCASPEPQQQPAAVGSFPPNAFGLNDMIGNVWQWTADCFPADLAALGRQDPAHFNAVCLTPSIRGGAASNPLEQCRPGFRVNYWWRGSPNHLGFRVVRLQQGEARQ